MLSELSKWIIKYKSKKVERWTENKTRGRSVVAFCENNDLTTVRQYKEINSTQLRREGSRGTEGYYISDCPNETWAVII